MKTIPLLFALLLGQVFLAKTLMAQDSSVGCGLGTMAIGDNRTLVSATARFSLNWLAFNQLFGVSSGTSGCGKYRLVQYQPQWQERYFYAHQEDLIEELIRAQIKGPILTSFPQTPLCLTSFTAWTKQEAQSLGQALLLADTRPLAWKIFSQKINDSCQKQLMVQNGPSPLLLFGLAPAKY